MLFPASGSLPLKNMASNKKTGIAKECPFTLS